MPSYLHDVFVSYQSNDRPWVERFVDDLQREVSQRAGRQVLIWWDRQNIGPGDDWNRKMLEDARQSRVFVPVVSPSWHRSEPCQQELAAFLESLQPESLLPAMLLPTEPLSPEIQKATYVEFFKTILGVPRLLKRQPREDALQRLAHAIVARLPQSAPLLPPGAGIDQIVAAIRERIAPSILEKCGWMRILNMSQRIDVGEIYAEVNVFERVRAKQIRPLAELQADPQLLDSPDRTTVKRVPAKEALIRHPRLMILGKPGGGKTTFLRRLAVECVRGEFRSDLVPAYIEFRALQDQSIQEALRAHWETDPTPILRVGRALLLLDGLDELPSANFEAIRQELDDILTRDTRSLVLLTCRIAAREYVSERFNEIEIAEFTEGQQADFACQWFPARGCPAKVEPFLKGLQGNSRLRELATSPLLLTMICLYFEDHQDLEVSRADLYRKGLDTVLERWDASRGIRREDSPYGRLSTSARESLYATIAFRHFELGEVVFPVPAVREFFPENVEDAAILQVMEAQHGLLIQRAQGIYSFSHLTFQEYLVARHFAEDSDPVRWDRLLPHLPDARWREVFVLVCSMVSADYLVRRMQEWLNALVATRPAVQELLHWAGKKQEATGGNYNPAAVRVWYLEVGRLVPLTRARDLNALDLDLTHDLALDLDRDLALARDLALDLDLARTLSIARARARDRDLARDRDFDRARALDLDLDLDLARTLALARDRGLKLDQAFLNELKDILKSAESSLDHAWLDRLQQAMVRYRDIGHYFPLDRSDFHLLARYLQGHGVLIACLQSGRVSPAARETIESSLFLPAPA